jgi:hypothetical protein
VSGVLVNLHEVNGSAGQGDSNVDTAAYADALGRIATAGRGTLLIPPAASGEWLFDEEIGIPDHCAVAGAGRQSTVIKIPDGAGITPFVLRNAATGAVGISISGLTIDGNHVNNSVVAYGIYLVRASDFSVFDVEIMNINGSGLTTDGMQTFCGPGHIERVYAHDCDNIGIQISNATRRVNVLNVHSERCGGYGFAADASEMMLSGANLRRNLLAGLYIRNVFGCTIDSVVATMNDGHGILVQGFVRSTGSNWLAEQNGRSPVNTADDIHFGANPVVTPGLGYGETSDVRITNIVAGPSANHYANYFGPSFTAPTERNAIHLEDQSNLNIYLEGNLMAGAISGDIRYPTDPNKLVTNFTFTGGGRERRTTGPIIALAGVQVPSVAGVPTDAAFKFVSDGMLALDNSTGKLYVRSQGAWVAQS